MIGLMVVMLMSYSLVVDGLLIFLGFGSFLRNGYGIQIIKLC